MSLINEMAPEVVKYQEAELKARQEPSNENFDASDAAFKTMLEARRAEAAIALHDRAKATQEQHDSADQNALDTLGENGIDPDTDEGRLIYYRVYVSTLKLM